MRGLFALSFIFVSTVRGDDFSLTSADGTNREGRVVQFDSKKLILHTKTEIPTAELIALRNFLRPIPAWPEKSSVELAGGDVLCGKPVGGDDLAIRFAPTSFRGEWQIPFSVISRLRVAPETLDPARDDRPAPEDAVRLRSGDRIVGRCEGAIADPPSLVLKSEGKPTTIPFAKIAEVVFDPSLVKGKVPKGVRFRVVFTDGSRLTFSTLVRDEKGWKGKTTFGAEVTFADAEMVKLDAFGGIATPLGELTPRVKHEPFGTLKFEPVKDRTVHGTRMRMAEESGVSTYDFGLGTHSKTTLEYDLKGAYRRFETVVGLDAETGRKGNVDITIKVDGKDRTPEGLKRRVAGPALPIALDVKGAQSLRLVIDYGAGGNTQDDVNWADARLIK